MFERLVNWFLRICYPETFRPKAVGIRFDRSAGTLDVLYPVRTSGIERFVVDCGKANAMLSLVRGVRVDLSGFSGEFELTCLVYNEDVEVKAVKYHAADGRVVEMRGGDYFFSHEDLIPLARLDFDFAKVKICSLVPEFEEIENAFDL